jgi:hypothetical protein
MTEPHRYAWVSRGGCQIVGTLYREHAARVLEAWWAIQREREWDAGTVVTRAVPSPNRPPGAVARGLRGDGEGDSREGSPGGRI